MGLLSYGSNDLNKSSCSNINGNVMEQATTLLFTKLMVPSPPLNFIARETLISKLEEILFRKLTLVTAPAGYGKTTLMSLWMAKKGTSIKSAWVSLDEKDNKLKKFWACVILALESLNSGSKENYEATDFAIDEFSVEVLLNNLVNRLSHTEDEIVLVLDDYHLISEEHIHNSIQYLINYLPDNMHIVIISRTQPVMKLARLRGNSCLFELRVEELRLSFSEVSEFLTETMKLYLAENEVKRLEEWTEGWIAGLYLAALTIKGSTDIRKYLDGCSHINEYIFEYMYEEVFSLVDRELKDFLVKTSILDYLNFGLCSAVTGISDVKSIFSNLEKKNIFISFLDEEKNNYRYHSLFREFLRNRLMEVYPDLVEELYLKASRWYEDNGLIRDALDYSLRSANSENTIRLVEKYGEIMIINRDLMRVAEIIRSLPKQLVAQNARLWALYTLAVSGKNYHGGSGIFIGDLAINFDDDIFPEFKQEQLVIRMASAYGNADFSTALDCGNELVKHLSEQSFIQCLPYKILIQIYSTAGEFENAESCLNLYIDSLIRKNYYDELFIEITYVHIMVHILCGIGKYKDALNLIERLEDEIDSSKSILLPVAANSIYLDLGYLYYEYNEVELACSSINKCIDLCSKKMDIFRLVSGYVLTARIKQSLGNHHEAMEYIKNAEDLCSKYNLRFIMVNMFIYIVRTLLLIGDTEYAKHLAHKYHIAVQDSFDVEYEDAHLALADLFIAEGQHSEAERVLNKLYDKAKGTKRNLSTVRIMILKALLSKAEGNNVEALKYMRDAICKASEQGYIRTFLDYGTPAAEIIGKLLESEEGVSLTNKEDINYASFILSRVKEQKKLTLKADSEAYSCLSKRETEVLGCILKGQTNKEIASKLYIAECTVKKHINNIYAKIGAADREHAIQICMDLNTEQ